MSLQETIPCSAASGLQQQSCWASMACLSASRLRQSWRLSLMALKKLAAQVSLIESAAGRQAAIAQDPCAHFGLLVLLS